MDKKKESISKILKVIIIVLIGGLFMRMIDGFGKKEIEIDNYKWEKLLVILEQIEQNYVDTVKSAEITEKVLPYILQGLDPHSVYLPPAELEVAEESLEGNFSGIGIQFNVPDDTVSIISVVPGGPSEKAGLLSGDRIIKVNGENIAGVRMPQDSMVRRMKGPRGSMVKVEVKRNGVEERLTFNIKRDNIPVHSIDVAMMFSSKAGQEIGYVKLSKFAKTSYKEFVGAMEKLKAEGIKTLVFDLRDNTGGYLDQALLLANEFLSRGQLIVYVEGTHRAREDYFADGRGKFQDVELYVLVNEGSASSSEIFAGAIQDNDRGTIVGRRSFGKGLVQEPVYFTDNSGIRLTVARFYTPTGRCIQKPYSDDYQYDILERYQHGEMIVADSIKRNDSLKFVTPGGKIVYGGGGIIPDIFVPMDTTGVTQFMINVNRKSLLLKYSASLADRYRSELREVRNLTQLTELIATIDIEKDFLAYTKANGVVPAPGEWERSRWYMIPQIEGLFGRYSMMEDDAYYPYVLKIDNVIQRVLKEEGYEGCEV